MNKDNAKDFLPLVQALAEGKTIQVLDNGIWKDGHNLEFAYLPSAYRIKPEPREWTLKIFSDGSATAYTDEQIKAGAEGTVRVREVID